MRYWAALCRAWNTSAMLIPINIPIPRTFQEREHVLS